jgi:ribokinase
VRNAIKIPGGAAANVIRGLASFGLKCRFYSTIGYDSDAEFFIESMESADIELKLNVTHSETGRVDVYVDNDGERTFFVHPNAAGIADVRLSDSDYEEIDHFYLDPFPSEDSFNMHVKVARNARKYGKFVVLNPGFPYSSLGFEKLSELLQYVNLVLLSEPEFASLNKNEEDFLRYVDMLVVTMGERGSRAVMHGKSFYQPAFEAKVVDTTGAGDVFAAGFLYAFLKGMPIETCLKTGNFVAAYSIQYYGARNLPKVEEVEKLLNGNC